MEHWGALAAVLAFFLQSILLAIAGTKALGGMEARIKDKITEHKREVSEDLENMRREFGETVAAIREKINVVELEGAKSYMRRESGQSMKDEIMEQVGTLGDDLKKRLDRIEDMVHKN